MGQSALLDHDPAFTPPWVAPPRRHPSTPRFLYSLVDNPLRIVPREAYERPILERRLLGKQVLMVMEPSLVEEVLKQTFHGFPKSNLEARVLGPMLGHGLLTTDGDDWRFKRRISSPAFRPRDVSRYVPVLARPFDELAAAWSAQPGVRRVDEATIQATFRAIIDAMFSGSQSIDADLISRALGTILDVIGWPIAYESLRVPFSTPHPGRARMQRATRDMREAARHFIRSRQGEQDPPQDLGQALIDATDPNGERILDEEDLIDMMLTLLLAGHETSANGLAWALLMLAHYPDHQEAVRGEVADIVGDGPITPDHIERLPVTERFLKETMRLYPPAAMLRRTARDAVQLGPVVARPGCAIVIPIYTIHRHHALWDEPHRFDPERFLPERESERHRMAYLPFGAGPRVCIGAGFAMTEMVAGLAMLVRRLAFSPVPGFQPRPSNRVTLRSENGVKVQVDPLGGPV